MRRRSVIAWLLCLAMLVSALAGINFNRPMKAEAAVSYYTTPITEYASSDDTTTWKILFVLPMHAALADNSRAGDSLSESDANDYVNYIVPNFEACVYEYSKHYMKVESTIVTIDEIEASDTGTDDVIKPETVKTVLESGKGFSEVKGTLAEDLGTYDAVVCSFAPGSTDTKLQNNYAGLGGWRFADYKSSYTLTILSPGMALDEEKKAYKDVDFKAEDGKMLYYYYSELIVHEFIHGLEHTVKTFYPSAIRRNMPTPDGLNTYYKFGQVSDLMNDFYQAFFQGNVPTAKGSKKRFGMTVDDYKRPPSKYYGQLEDTTITTLEEWNDLMFAIDFGKKTKGATISLGANIDARGKEIASVSSFSGTLDGKGYAIIGANLGTYSLLGNVTENATVKNLLLINANLKHTTGYRVGAIAEYNYGTITNCGVTGSIIGGKLVGGLVGANETTGVIKNCFNGAYVNGLQETYYLGGIAGFGGGSITNCYNYGYVVSTLKKASYGISGVSSSDNSYMLEGTARYLIQTGGDTKTADFMKTSNFVALLNKNETAFAAGNGFPTIQGAKYNYHDGYGTTKELVTAASDVDAYIWKGGVKTTLKTGLVATKWINSSGSVKAGQLKWIVKNEPTDIEFNTETHALLTKTDTTIATVSGKGVVTGKNAGTAYVYAVDTGSMRVEAFKIQVKGTPSNVRLYYSAEDDPVKNAMTYTSDIVPAGGKVKIYYKGTTGSITKTANTMAVMNDEELTYSLVLPAKYKDYMTVTQDVEKGCFEVALAENIMSLSSKGKAFTASLVIKNDQNNKKAGFKMVVSKPVKTMVLAAGDDSTQAKTGDDGIFTVSLASAKTEAQTGIVKEDLTLYNDETNRTDGTKIVRIPCANGYKFNSASALLADGATSSEQKKVSLAAVKGQTGVYKITAKKGTQPGTEAYFALYHNGYGRTEGKGFKIVKVVVGEANHVASMKITKEENSDGVLGEDDNGITIAMDSAKTEAKSVTLEEAITLANSEKEGTDYNLIYPVPNAVIGDGFSINTAKTLVANGTLSAGQKKVKMASVSGQPGQYKITAAKGTPEGTEAYFVLFHNESVYQVISVTVGTTNKVSATAISTEDANVTLTKDNLTKSGNTYNILTMPAANTALQSTIIKEATTLPNTDLAATDVTKILRMNGYEAFSVATNRSTVTAVGALTAAQKKVTLKAVSGEVGSYKVTAAKGTPIGTEVYFMIYHNYDKSNRYAGKGYSILKVVVGEAQ